MSAVLKPDVSTRRRSPDPSAVSTRRTNVAAARGQTRPRSRAQLTALPSVSPRSPVLPRSPVRSLPTSRAVPAWLHLLILAQRGSSVVMFLLISVTLVIYGWTVYSQQLWGQEYRKLEGLQRQERQTTAANEVLKDQMAREAESPTAGLALPDSSRSVFLQPAPDRPSIVLPSEPPVAPLAPAKPLAY